MDKAARERVLLGLRFSFLYRPDGPIDSWRILKGPGKLLGDCDDFAVTLLWRLSNRSLLQFWWNILTLRGVIWMCKSERGRLHVCLKYRGQWADNIYPMWSPSPRFKLIFPMIAPWVALKLAIGRFTRR